MTTAAETISSSKTSGIQVIARAAAIMRALSRNPQGLSLAAIACEVELPRSTVQRIINALVDEMWVEQAGPAGGVRLGPALGKLINRVETDIITLTRPYLQDLLNQVQESICLCSLSGNKIYVIDRLVAERELRVVFPIGVYAPAYVTAPGKILLSELPEVTVRNLLPDSLDSFTSQTPSLDELVRQLRQARTTQIAGEYDEFVEGVGSYAVALDTYLGFYALAVVAPTARLNRQAEMISAQLLQCKNEIERAIGHRLG